MAEPEFSATGVEIGKWLRPLTRAGQVLISDGRLRLLTSRGAEIDSAPVERVVAGASWSAPGSARATINGRRYRIGLGAGGRSAASAGFGRERAAGPGPAPGTGLGPGPAENAQHAVRRFLDALHHARRD